VSISIIWLYQESLVCGIILDEAFVHIGYGGHRCRCNWDH